MDNWVNEEFFELELGDKRVNKSGKKIIEKLASQPGAAIPSVFRGFHNNNSNAWRYLNRKNDPPPGPKAMWIGFNRIYDFALHGNPLDIPKFKI